jgi:2C-methyl-D-erythritol 2,4-cyclodiphosphate synthase
MRIGIGYDSHRLVKGRKLILGGLEIPFEKGFDAHSDGDVLCHAIIDSILGALGAGDIGKHFPDNDIKWKNASSIMLLDNIVQLTRLKNFDITWIDSIIIAEKPRISSYIEDMKEAISIVGIPKNIIA